MDFNHINQTVDSRGHCFLCLGKIHSPQLAPRSCLKHPVYSFQYLSRYLKMDINELCLGNETGERTGLKVELCKGCGSLTDGFSKSYRQLEKLKMELNSKLELIHGKLRKAEDTNKLEVLRNLQDSVEGFDFGTLEGLRTETMLKCSTRLGATFPKIKLNNMSPVQQSRCSDSPLAIGLQSIDIIKVEPSREDLFLEEDPESFISNVSDSSYVEEQVTTEASIVNWVGHVEVGGDTGEGTLDDKTAPVSQGSNRIHKASRSSTRIHKKQSEAKKLAEKKKPEKYRKNKIKQLKCSYCDKVFRYKSQLIRHTFVHKRVENFKCSDCSSAFTRQDLLTRHMLTHSGSRKHKCSECSMTFLYGWQLAGHTQRHAGQKPHQCTKCTEAFVTSGELRQHMFSHTTKRPFKCDHKGCKKNYKDPRSLSRHIRRAHNTN